VCTKDSGTNNVLVNPCLTFYKLSGLLASLDFRIFGFYNKKQKNEKKNENMSTITWTCARTYNFSHLSRKIIRYSTNVVRCVVKKGPFSN